MELNVEKNIVMRVSRQSLPIQIMIDQKLLGNGDYFNYLGSVITSEARSRWEIKSRISMEIAIFNKKKKTLFTRKLDLYLRKKLAELYIWSIALWNKVFIFSSCSAKHKVWPWQCTFLSVTFPPLTKPHASFSNRLYVIIYYMLIGLKLVTPTKHNIFGLMYGMYLQQMNKWIICNFHCYSSVGSIWLTWSFPNNYWCRVPVSCFIEICSLVSR